MTKSAFCQDCKRWVDPHGHELCPAHDGDRTVEVPLAALRALVERARWDDDWLPSYGVDEDRVTLDALVAALGVEGL